MHGTQFDAEMLKVTSRTGAEGIEKYLGSGSLAASVPQGLPHRARLGQTEGGAGACYF